MTGGRAAGEDAPAIGVLVVDDEAEVREAMSRILGSAPGLRVVGAAVDGDEAVAGSELLDPDVVVMDLRMPRCDGVEATRRLRAVHPVRPAVVALTTFATVDLAVEALGAGATAFVAKSDPPELWVEAVRLAAGEGAFVSPSVLRALLPRLAARRVPTPNPCSAREVEVLGLLSKGMSNAEIGRHLYISEATVRTHLQHLRAKLSVGSRTELVVRAFDLGVATVE